MGQYGGIYRAFCVDGETLRVTIPQIFGETAVPLYTWVTSPPVSQQFGAVSFVSGDPAYPIWLGAEEATLTPGRGDKGDPGIAGPPGPPGVSFTYPQSTPSAVWVINHNLGKYVSVEVLDQLGKELVCDVQHLSINQVSITHLTPLAGYVIVS